MYLSHVHHCVWSVYNLHFPHLAADVPWVSHLVIHLLNPENMRRKGVHDLELQQWKLHPKPLLQMVSLLGMLILEETQDSFQLAQRDSRAASVVVNEDDVTEVSCHHLVFPDWLWGEKYNLHRKLLHPFQNPNSWGAHCSVIREQYFTS